jgi:competence protein ComEC
LQKIQELIEKEIAAQKDRLFLWAPFCLAVGIGLYFSLEAEPPLLLGGSLIVMAGGLVLYGWKAQGRSPGEKFFYLCAIGILIACIGFAAAQMRAHTAYTPMLVKKMKITGVEGTIESIEPSDKGSRAVLTDLIIERTKPEDTPRKIRLSIRKDEGLKAGQRVKLLAGLNPASPPVAPGAFDFQRMAYFEGLGAVGFAYSAPEILAEGENPVSLAGLRKSISDKIRDVTDNPQQSILVALMTGQRKAIRDEDWRALRESGLAHMLAISGLHVGMVAGVLFFFSRLFMAFSPALALHRPIKKYAAVIALIGACLYTVIVGATIPTQRALMMTALVMIAILLDRSPFSLRLVAFAAFVVLLFTPESLMSVSFQMSFAAVTALICFYDFIRPVWIKFHRRAGIMRRAGLYFMGVLLTTLIAGTATGLFALYHFQQYALYGLLANIIAVPLLAFVVMPVTVLSYFLMPLGLENFTLPLAEWGVSWILATAYWVAGMDGAVWRVAVWPHGAFVAMVLVLWLMIVWKGRQKYFLVPVFLLLCLPAFLNRQPDILISRGADLIAVRDQTGALWLSTGRAERYTAENWLRRNGETAEDKKIWLKAGEGEAEYFPLTCGSYGCRGKIKEQKIAVAFTQKASQEDCNWADILIADQPIHGSCRARYKIDFFDVWRNGPYAIWLSPEKVKIKTVEGVRGRRLWTQTAANQKED